MFLHLKVPPADCKFLGLLWRRDFDKVIEVYEYTSHIWGAKNSTSAIYALQQTGFDKAPYPPASWSIKPKFYVDGFANSVATDEEAIKLYQQLKESLRKGRFNLTNGFSISINVVESFDDTDETDQTIKSSEAEPSMSSLLGLHCNMEDDCLDVCHAATKEVPGEIT